MAKISDEEKSSIRQAADAARTMLPKIREQQQALNARAESLEALIKADEMFNPQRKIEKGISETESGDLRKRARKGQVGKHIDAILSDGSEMEESTLREKIKETFQANYGRATIYTALKRGFKQHRYDKQGKKWKLGSLTMLRSA